MNRSLIISGAAHAVLLMWGLVAFAARPGEAPQTEALPVEFVSTTEFSQLTAGVKNAPKAIENAKPLADKVGDPKPVKELAPKVAFTKVGEAFGAYGEEIGDPADVPAAIARCLKEVRGGRSALLHARVTKM